MHDWQAALVPVLMLDQKLREGWSTPPPTCLTIHNMAYQGWFPKGDYYQTQLGWDQFHSKSIESFDGINLLKGAGVDLSSPKAISSALDVFGQYLDKFEALVNEGEVPAQAK